MYCCVRFIHVIGAGAATAEFVVVASEFTFHSSLFLGENSDPNFLFQLNTGCQRIGEFFWCSVARGRRRCHPPVEPS